jgi:polyferredoxin
VIFLVPFGIAMIKGKPQIWMAFVLLSIFLAPFFGRYYCGWACPINTLIRPVEWLGQKLGTYRKAVPSTLESEIPRYLLFVIFLGGLGFTIYRVVHGSAFPLPLIVIPIGLLTGFFINQRAWHRYLCPWGVLFGLTARYSKPKFASTGCRSCASCSKACPTTAIAVSKGKSAQVKAADCLFCFDCVPACPNNAMAYGFASAKEEPPAIKLEEPVKVHAKKDR